MRTFLEYYQLIYEDIGSQQTKFRDEMHSRIADDSRNNIDISKKYAHQVDLYKSAFFDDNHNEVFDLKVEGQKYLTFAEAKNVLTNIIRDYIVNQSAKMGEPIPDKDAAFSTLQADPYNELDYHQVAEDHWQVKLP